MWACFSARIKADSPCHTGAATNSVNAGEMSSSSSGVAPPHPGRSEGAILQSSNLKSFAYSDLKIATRNFRPDSVLGEGGFGSVFKGWIDESSFAPTRPGTGMVIAVKKQKLDSSQGHRQWLVSRCSTPAPPRENKEPLLCCAIRMTSCVMWLKAEVGYLGLLHHPHLVRLVGYCLEDEHRLLVYEFMPRGSLENHLFRRGSYFQPLPWNLRLKVALGAAKGLAFLHTSRVIYRDFKASNVLLDSKYNAKLSDFGLAKDGPTGDKSHVSTRVMGTCGYAAPEYLATGHLTTKSDIYSFGVVLLEMLSGRRAVDKNRPPGEHNLVEWAKPYIASSKKVFRAMDNRLEGQYTMEEAHKVASLASRCLSMDANCRPSMDEVVTNLEGIRDSKEYEDGHHKSAGARHRMHKHGVDDAKDGSRQPVSYPRPSASPLCA